MLNENELTHYGVLGMKWGVRKDPQRAYKKSMKKLGSLDKKAQKKSYKSAKLQMKADKAEYKSLKAWTYRGQGKKHRKSLKLKRKSTKATFKSKKYERRAMRWVNKMNQHFAGVQVYNITGDEITLGKRYCLALMEDYYKS